MRVSEVLRFFLRIWTKTLLLSCCLCAELASSAAGLDVVPVLEGSDAILNCSPSHKADLRSMTFDWKKDGKLEVFLYDKGSHYSNGRQGQDQQFQGRVSLFEDELRNGNASIRIRDTRVGDSGNYSCIFPSQDKRFFVQLVVQPVFKDRSSENRDAISRVHTVILDATEAGVPLKCEVEGAFPEPQVWWEDDGGKRYEAVRKPRRQGDGPYNITVTASVTRTASRLFSGVVVQKEIHHEIRKEIYVPEKMFQVCEDHTSDKVTWLVVGGVIGGVSVGVIVGLAMTLLNNR